MEDLIFNPVTRYPQAGNEIQICETSYKGVHITERTFFPWNIFQNISVLYILDLVLPMETKVEGGEMSDVYYTDEGYGLPVFKDLDKATAFIDKYKSS
jgi:hypothetical protein